MQCKTCGTIIPPGARHCPACGTPTGNTGPYQETASSSPLPPAGSQPDRTVAADAYNPGSFWEPATPSPQQERVFLPGSYNPGSFQEPASSPPPGSEPDRTMLADPYTPRPPVGSFPGEYGQSGAPGQPPYYAGSQQPPYAVPQQPFPPPPPQQPPKRARRGLSRGMTILLIVLALLIMASGFGLIYYSAVYHPAQLHAQATSTAQTMQTAEARATALANAQATGTAVAIANATATAQAQATAEVVATATALQNIYNSATSGTPALNDSLAGNSGSGWDEDQAQGGGGCAFTGGAYHASLYSKGFYFPCFARNTNFSNFAFQVQMTITQGDVGGLIFRANPSANKFYVLRLGTDGLFDLFLAKDSTHTTDLSYGNSSAIKKAAGQTNLMTVVARNSNIYLYINKQYVGSVSDGTYQSGQIGFLVSDRTNSTDVAYSNAQVWTL